MKIDKDKINKIKLYSLELLFVFSTIGELVGYYIKNDSMLIVFTFVLFISAILYCAKNIKMRIIFCVFLICFFTFIMGQYLTQNNGVNLYIYDFNINTRIHTIVCIYISLLGLILGQILAKNIDKENNEIKNDEFYLKNDFIKLRKISKIFFLVTIGIMYICLIERILYKMEYGYLGYIANFESKLPFIITYVGSFASIFIYIFLSTMPTKKELILPISLYSIYLILNLFTGSRSTFVLGVICLIIYIIIREYMVKNKSEKIITLKKILIVAILIPILIVFLNIYNVTRNNNEIKEIDIFTEFNNFFMNQGSSVAVISLGKEYEEQLSLKRYPYMFYSIVKEVESKWNPSIYGPIKNSDEIEKNVYASNAFATKISYMYYGDKIMEGHGLGTSYIAEAYADGGYIGVLLINLLFGIFIYAFNKLVYKNWIGFTVVMLVLLQFMYVPRDPTFNWVNSLTAINLWIGILSMYCITLNKKQYIEKGDNE